MSKALTTPVTEYLDSQQIDYQLLHQTQPTITIEETARQRDVRPSQMVKSIVLRDMGNQYALACLPGDKSVDPKRVRALLNCRRMTCVARNEIESVTGYQAGTVNPLLLKSTMPIFFDSRLLKETTITISSGDPMLGVGLSCQDLIALCNPFVADICRRNKEN
ncbi:aminoacyl-tRNA deacylase [Vibrio amylolyticus]|uniref:aminoacyl-tRNA deacylase n=1 Tax=Vibrio amylolyticus TaxID=2847292 RepID=UPI00354FA912